MGDDAHRVLLAVDDEEDIRFLMRLCFDSTKYDVLTARDGNEAVRALREDGIDLVFLDLRMPGLDGWGVLDAMAAEDFPNPPPVVVVSAHASPEASEAALERGATHFISKPFTRDQVLTVAERYAPTD